MYQSIEFAPLPMPLHWQISPERFEISGAALEIAAGARTDLFVDPQGEAVTLNAPCLIGPTSGDFMLSARVSVAFAATFDAGVLLLYAGARLWAKLCFEYSPQGQPMVVSVVTRGVSDDCNSFVVDGNSVWLRVARLGRACAFHASTDGNNWQLVRHFALDNADALETGFLAQSPTGAGCVATFEQIRYSPERLADLRSGV
jgi:regulation of enolase protein 1 (concanavalin A-like superfamily)